MKEGASDIHIQPEDESLNIRYRVDGVLVEVASCPKNFQAAILSRIKVMAELNIAEHRIPQDGRFEFDRNGTSADIRIATLPTIHGENIVMRVLNSTSSLPTQQQLGFSEELLNQMQKVQRAAHGIILVTGPTGSGKTTTLYTCLAQIDTKQNNIMTVEDPVEYRLPGIRQIQINTKVKLTFANSLRSILRQDPDVILIGEIRDSETAGIAVQAAMTGHLVFSTLHTNDAPSSIMRLIDMNVEPFLVASSVIAVLAQRLVRTICSNCKEEYIPTKTALDDLDLPKDGVYYRGKGCAKCNQTGYKGRVGIYELMIPDRHIRDLVSKRSSIDEIRKQAKTLGMTTLQVDGKAKIKEGLTTIEEVVRVTQDE
ncbi:MAG: type II secretory ATPase GspE/PulE/Tfp pilus assembly ATPase PilB-like protein [Candidatus Omnitrophota bacterium]|jgi:type II secretory ATPase GspE/PulE/Tfp pilus assembly ATPase PilB-like protein